MVQNLVPSTPTNLSIASVYCAENTSFALLKASATTVADELFSWGSSQDGILGVGTSAAAHIHTPRKVELKFD